MRIDYSERARALVGVRFRPQGRGLDGLDCVGVIVATFGLDPGGIRQNYTLRGQYRDELGAALAEHFRRVPNRQLRPGDVMLMSTGPRQAHLAVRTEAGFVHAHAGIRRVVETPGMPEWPLVAAYRRRSR
jgi:murein DD-endopeptidase / murein LD-carboxypeptidase